MKKIAIFVMALLILLTTSVQADLVGLWHFDGDATDSSVYGNDGTISGASWVDGICGSALNFDGTFTGDQADGDYVLVPGSSSLYITDKLTVAAWIKPTGIPDRWYGDVLRLGRGYELCLRGDVKLEIALYRSSGWGWWDSISAIPIAATNFYHVAFTYDKDGGANNLKIYIDGALDAQYTVGTGALQSSGDLWISPWFWPFEGIIDEVRIYNVALTAVEVAAAAEGCGVIEVEIDIKPGSYPNSINPGSQGVIPIAILTTDDFDAATVDPASISIARLYMATTDGKVLCFSGDS